MQSLKHGLVHYDVPPVHTVRGQHWMLISSLYTGKLLEIERSKIGYMSAMVDSLLKYQGAEDQRHEAMIKLSGDLVGRSIDLKQLRIDDTAAMMRRYEAITGLAFGSPELDAAVDLSIKSFTGK